MFYIFFSLILFQLPFILFSILCYTLHCFCIIHCTVCVCIFGVYKVYLLRINVTDLIICWEQIRQPEWYKQFILWVFHVMNVMNEIHNLGPTVITCLLHVTCRLLEVVVSCFKIRYVHIILEKLLHNLNAGVNTAPNYVWDIFSLSPLSHTHRYTLSHTHTLSFFLLHTHIHTLCLTHTFSLSYTHIYSLFPCHIWVHTLSLSQHTFSHTLSFSLIYIHTHTLHLFSYFTHSLFFSLSF